MKTLSHLLFFSLQVVVSTQKEHPSTYDHVSTNIADLLPKFVQKLACYKEKTNINSLALLQAQHVVHVTVNTVLTQGELQGWEYVMDLGGEYGYVQIPQLLLDTTLKDSPYIKLSLLVEDKSQEDKIQAHKIFTVHELASDFVIAVTTALSDAFKKLDKKEEDFFSSKASLEKIISNVETSLDKGNFDAQSFSFDFTEDKEFLDKIIQSLLKQAAMVTCHQPVARHHSRSPKGHLQGSSPKEQGKVQVK